MISNQVIRVRKINERRNHYDELIKEENKKIYDATVTLNSHLYAKPSKLMRKVYAMCYADTCYRCEDMIAYWEHRFIEDKNRILTEEILTLDQKCATF